MTSDFDRDDHAPDSGGRPATVWPCPPATLDREPTGWLQAAMERLVALHTHPGDPVLLLTPPPLTGPDPHRHAGNDDPADDWIWAVARLGRPARVWTPPASPLPSASESGSGPALGPEADRAALVVTVVAPTRLDWIAHVPWSRLLAPGGTLAVITRSDSIAGWLIDPTHDLTDATGRHGLALLDRFVLLEVPIDQLDRTPAPLPRGAAARRVHSDLLLFTGLRSERR